MFARVYDRENNRYYKSVVYGMLNGGLSCIVLDPKDMCFKLVSHNRCVETIKNDTTGWLSFGWEHLLKLKELGKSRGEYFDIDYFHGFKDVINNIDFMASLLEKGKVRAEGFGIELRPMPRIEGWNYIRTQSDAYDFMKSFAGFHDSKLESIYYTLTENGEKRITAILDNHFWFGRAELIFEGVLAANIRPPMENQSLEIFEGSLIVNDDCTVFWADEVVKNGAPNDETTWIKAMDLRWRKKTNEE